MSFVAPRPATPTANRTGSRFPGLAPCVLGLCLLSASAGAQTPVASWTLRVYAAGQSVPISTTPLTSAMVQCNQAPTTMAPTNANPIRIAWTDTGTANRECVYVTAGGPVLAVPAPGNYELTLTATGVAGSANAGTSVESARLGFTRVAPPPIPPPVPTGLHLAP